MLRKMISNVDSYEDLITKFELDRTKEKPVSTPVTEKEKDEDIVQTKDETKTKPKEKTENDDDEFGDSRELAINIAINKIASDVVNSILSTW